MSLSPAPRSMERSRGTDLAEREVPAVPDPAEGDAVAAGVPDVEDALVVEAPVVDIRPEPGPVVFERAFEEGFLVGAADLELAGAHVQADLGPGGALEGDGLRLCLEVHPLFVAGDDEGRQGENGYSQLDARRGHGGTSLFQNVGSIEYTESPGPKFPFRAS